MELNEYRRIAAASETHWWYRSTRALLTEFIEPHLAAPTPSTRYLDAAGGTGATGRWLAERAPTVLADYEALALELAAGTASSHPYLPVRADLKDLPHPDESFDAVLCVTALYHRMNKDPQVVVDGFARVTKAGGLVCLMEPGVRRLWRAHDDVTHAARRFSLGDIRRLLERAGLELVRASGAYSFLVPPAAVLTVGSRLARHGERNGDGDNGADFASEDGDGGGDRRGRSDVSRSDSTLSGTFAHLAAVERRMLRHVSIPFGLSVLAIGKKPDV